MKYNQWFGIGKNVAESGLSPDMIMSIAHLTYELQTIVLHSLHLSCKHMSRKES